MYLEYTLSFDTNRINRLCKSYQLIRLVDTEDNEVYFHKRPWDVEAGLLYMSGKRQIDTCHRCKPNSGLKQYFKYCLVSLAVPCSALGMVGFLGGVLGRLGVPSPSLAWLITYH